MENIILLHGTSHIIEKPDHLFENPNNDYGNGFYCTEILEMAKEWACKENKEGFVNRYKFNMDGLKVLNLLEGNYNILNWIAILLKYRKFNLHNQIAIDAREYVMENYGIDVEEYDVIIGYRADDSYFSYAESFVENTLPLRSLNRALRLGKLGTQVVLKSEKAFSQIEFIDAEPVEKEVYYPKFLSRDTNARKTYKDEIKNAKSYRNDIFVMDILREEMKNDDARIQRIVSEWCY